MTTREEAKERAKSKLNGIKSIFDHRKKSIGETVEIAIGTPNLIDATIIDEYDWDSNLHYILRVDTHVDSYLVIRPFYLCWKKERTA